MKTILPSRLLCALSLVALWPAALFAQSANSGGNSTSTKISGSPDGELILGGPGVGLSYLRVFAVPFAHTADIGKYYKFTVTGLEAQADADGVAGAYAYDGYMWDKAKKSNNGHGNNVDGVDSSNPGKAPFTDTDPTVDDEIKTSGDGTSGSTSGSSGATQVSGWWEFWARVNTVELRSLSFSTAELNQLSGILHLHLSTPAVFREQNITLSWEGNGNSTDPDGHFYILGSAIKEPPVPFGELVFGQAAYQAGEHPPFQWGVVRD